MNGVLYFTVPDHAWAVDARTGREIWHYKWESKGGIHIGNRGVGIYGNWLYFETPDCHLVSLNLKDGKERWNTEICDLEAALLRAPSRRSSIRNHVMVGVSGDDLDVPGYLESRDPETGRSAVALEHRARSRANPDRRHGPNAEADGAWRRHDLAAGHLRSRVESVSISAPAIRSR